jgi:hypothetical protein
MYPRIIPETIEIMAMFADLLFVMNEIKIQTKPAIMAPVSVKSEV